MSLQNMYKPNIYKSYKLLDLVLNDPFSNKVNRNI